ncbi:MAG: tetratricopeptide repeat protein [Bacteroidaceae bacterium]|nr:tetratricopeptide repeat protein [Bacteroidaceae bacterium]
MKKAILFFTAIFLSITLQAQEVTQAGATYRYNGKEQRTPIGRVYVKSTSSPNGVLSDSIDGTFSITLPGLEMGDRIGAVTITKRGMMIFNKQAVEEWSVRKEPLSIILCDAAEFEKKRNNLIAIGEREAKKRYDKQLAEIEALYKEESVEYYKKLDELQKELSAAREKLEEYADVFARIDESEIDTLAQQAVELFNAGELERAIELFEQGNYIEKLRNTNRTIKQADELITTAQQAKSLAAGDKEKQLQSIKTQVAAYKLQNNWEKAGELLKALADEEKTYETMIEYAEFCEKQNKFKEAEAYCNNCLDIADNDDDKATTLNNLAILYSNTQRLKESEKYFSEVLEIFRRLAMENPAAYEPDVAMTLNNLAILYSDTQRLKESEQYYIEALEIYKRIAKENPEAYKPNVAMTLNNLALLYKNTQRFKESEQYFSEALEIQRRLAKENPAAYEPYVAKTLNNLAYLYSNTQRLKESEQYYTEALEIRRRLAKENPEAYEHYVAKTLNNLAYLYSNTQRLKEGELYYSEALEIQRRLAKENPEAYEPDVAMSLNNLAYLYSNTQRLKEGELYYSEALEIQRRLAKENPAAYEPNVATMLNNLAILYSNTQRLKESEQYYTEALEIRRRLAKENPEAYEPDVAMSLNNLAILYYNTQRLKESELYYIEALEIYRRLAKENPTMYEQDIKHITKELQKLNDEREQAK